MKKTLLFLSWLFAGIAYTNAQTILGVDVSHYQSDNPYGNIYWASVKNPGGKTFAFAKATEGISYTDPAFVTNMVNGHAAGVVMGAYHFARPESNTATAEANYFVSVAGTYIGAGYLPPVLDLEDPPSGSGLTSYFTSTQLTTWVQTFMTTVQNATGVAPVIYTSGSIASYLNSSLNVYGLWSADPDGSSTNPPNAAHLGVWTTWLFKQYSWTSAVSGINDPNNDLDVFNGDATAFNNLINGTSVSCTPPSTPTPTSPGTSSAPGSSVSSVTLQWGSVSGVSGYYPRISQCPYGSANIIWYDTCYAGTSENVALPTGNLYRWNMAAYSQCGNSGCESGNSNTLYFNIPPVLTSTGSTTFCTGDSVKLSTTAGNTVSAATFLWYRNSALVATTASGTYYASQTGSYTAVIQYSCGNTGASNAINVTVNASPTVSASASTAQACTGQQVTLTATGNASSYQWSGTGLLGSIGSSVNAVINTAGTQTYTVTATLNSCTATSSASVNFNTSVIPAITISQTTANPLCAGAAVSFSTTISNGGSNPAYQWRTSGGQTGTGNNFTINSATNGLSVYCTLTSNATCANPDTVVSNTIVISADSVQLAMVSISTPDTNICAGDNITFNAIPVAGGNSPAFTWYLNGSSAGTGSTFTISNMQSSAAV
ncbi:MAG TPA: glycoside hydrolase family 25 protein, partial [Chitinophagales bacterium]|nr:glycoside hydrolase family 25 protein [Chitinophagales bacterium]